MRIFLNFILVSRNPPKSPDEWLQLIQMQEKLHAKEMRTWQTVIQSAIDLLRKVSEVEDIATLKLKFISFRLNIRCQSFKT